MIDPRAIERAVLADRERPCLYGVMGPCQHPNCLESHYHTLYEAARAALSPPGRAEGEGS